MQLKDKIDKNLIGAFKAIGRERDVKDLHLGLDERKSKWTYKDKHIVKHNTD